MIRVALILLALTLSMHAQEAAATRPDILELIDTIKATDAMDKYFTVETMESQMRLMLRPENAAPEQRQKMERFIKEFAKEFTAEVKENRKVLIDMTAAIYAKYYTPEDVKAIVAFYKTPVGQKMAGLTAKVGMEAMTNAQTWGQALGQKIGSRVGQRIDAESAAPPPAKK